MNSDIQNLRDTHGYNEFSVSAPEPVLLKFAKTIYESPLILLLCGSATVSAIMGNVDDAVSITIAVLIVLTGKLRNDPITKPSVTRVLASGFRTRTTFRKES